MGELAQVLGQSQPRVSRHLKILADAGVLERRKEGSWVFLTLAEAERVEPLFALVDSWADASTQGCSPPTPPARMDPCGARAGRQPLFRRSRRGVGPDPLAACCRKRGRAGDRWHAEQAAARTLGRYRHRDRPHDRVVRPACGQASASIGLQRCFAWRGSSSRPPESSRAFARATCTRCLSRTECRQRIIHQVLHYAHSPAAAITEAARVIAPGGTLLVVDFAAHEREELRELTPTSASASRTR